MPNVAGVDTALLSKVNLSIEQAWSDSQAQVETKDLQAETLKIMHAKQKPLGNRFLEKVTDPEKDHDVKVYWPDFSALEAEDCATDVCDDLSGTQAPVKEQTYVINECIEHTVVVEEDKLATSAMDKSQYITDSMNDGLKKLLEKLNLKHVAFLEANDGYNHGVKYTYAAGGTEVPAADYTVDLMPQIMQDMVYSRIPNGFVVDGGPLHLPYIRAKLDGANGEGKGDFNRTQLFDAGFDLLGFAKSSLADSTFVVAPYAYASVTKNYVTNREPVYDEALKKWKYYVSLPMFGYKVDVYHQRICVDGAKGRFKLVWLFKLHYEIFANPTGFADGEGNVVSGILKYKKITA